jgi:uncharacterized protein involved in exopolysaccharide biosynthesis
MNEDEVDLRPYIAELIKMKWWIIGLGLLCGALALVISLLIPRTYTANGILLLTRSRAMLSLAEQFPTIAEPVDTRSRMDALIAIAKDDSIANMTLLSLGDAVPDKYRSIEDIKAVINIQNNGDSIGISATTHDPKLSAAIANSWADHLLEMINNAYSGDYPLTKIQESLVTAKEEYNRAQIALEDFIRQNPKKELETRLNEANNVLATYGSERAAQMAYYLYRKQSMVELKEQATTLKNQLDTGNQSTAGNIGDALAVIIARMNAVMSRSVNISNLPPSSSDSSSSHSTSNIPSVVPQQNAVINLQVDGDFPTNGTKGYTADIDAIIQVADEEIIKSDEKIDKLTQDTINPEPNRIIRITAVAAQIQELEQKIEAATATELELTSDRDLAWQAFQALAQKETEIKNAILANNQVTLASQAIVPGKPDPRGTVQKTFIAGLVGLLLGVVIVIGRYWWRSNTKTELSEQG